MLLELTIRNFAVIRDMRVAFAPGMNALTGETGAGKSIVIDALGAVLGARTSADVVRAGTSGAYIEAVFDLTIAPAGGRVLDALNAVGIAHDLVEPLVLSRDINASGRSTARVAGRTLTAATLATIGESLVDIHGQSDHLSLLRPAAQLNLLDRFADTLPLREQVAGAYRGWQTLRRRVYEFDKEQRALEQRLDLLRFQSEELAAADVRPGEDDELARERAVLANAERLARAAAEASGALTDGTGAGLDAGALDRIRAADRALANMTSMDPAIQPALTRLRDALFTLEEVASELRDYAERTELDPVRLEQVDDRLDLLRRLKRKYGPNLEDVLAHAEQTQRDLEAIEGGERDIEQLRADEAAAREELGRLAVALSARRHAAARVLAARVVEAIAELNMGRATFEARCETTPSDDGVRGPDGDALVAVDPTGIDHVSFYLAANAGEELRPLARVASGGETARLMLALKSILSAADDTPTLVFDEIDVGVGGRSGQVVGEKLWNLTHGHQVIVISHLPQIAAFADRHLKLVKHETNSRTETSVCVIDGAERVEEIAAMLDGFPVTAESRANAAALVERVVAWKRTVSK